MEEGLAWSGAGAQGAPQPWQQQQSWPGSTHARTGIQLVASSNRRLTALAVVDKPQEGRGEGGEAVWAELGQNRLAFHDPQLARCGTHTTIHTRTQPRGLRSGFAVAGVRRCGAVNEGRIAIRSRRPATPAWGRCLRPSDVCVPHAHAHACVAGRAEALERCRVAVVVLTPSLTVSHSELRAVTVQLRT